MKEERRKKTERVEISREEPTSSLSLALFKTVCDWATNRKAIKKEEEEERSKEKGERKREEREKKKVRLLRLVLSIKTSAAAAAAADNYVVVFYVCCCCCCCCGCSFLCSKERGGGWGVGRRWVNTLYSQFSMMLARAPSFVLFVSCKQTNKQQHFGNVNT